MLGIERRQKIMDFLRQEGRVYVARLGDHFNVTQETIRRDLEKLEKEGIAKRSHGGAVLTENANGDMTFEKRTTLNYSNKQVIGMKAQGLINDGDVIMADSSTTVLSLVGLLQKKKRLTVITNSVKILTDYGKTDLNMISCGGSLRANSYALVGPSACEYLSRFYVDTAIISCKGLDREKGILESNEAESIVKRQMCKQAQNRILLVDHSKFDHTVLYKMMDFTDINYIVTDQEPSPEWIDFFRKLGVQLIC